MKFQVFSISIILFINISTCKAQEPTLENKICKTWVSFQETERIPMLQKATSRKTTGRDVDSLFVREDHSVKRFNRGRLCTGVWSLSKDSTIIVFEFADCKSYYYPLKPDAFQLNTLNSDTIMMICGNGEEGEFTERWFRFKK